VTDTSLAAVLMAGGLGTRMRSAVPKHLHPILGRRMVDWIVEAGRAAGAAPIVIVASPATRDEFDPGSVQVAVQETALGTGDAVRCARASLAEHDGDVLVLSATHRFSPRSSCATSSRRTTARVPTRPSSVRARPTRACTGASCATRAGR
jgi:bifunctional N-acetylglucosamine-1-phosphate-uridyltransferase/glucosamine-1-phosphate-acetyltransferase GlmU-like protein